MAAVKRVALPAILLANDLLDGDVVFRSSNGWSRNPSQALIANDAEEADALEAAAKIAVDAHKIVDAYLVDVTIEANGLPVPNHFRERFKVLGPSVRPDLGKQAEFGSV